MKEWPKDPAQAVDFCELVNPIIAAIKFCYDLKRKNEDKDVPYNGYPNGWRERVTTPTPAEWLTTKSLKWNEEDQGREVLEVIISIALQLGIEQGRRIVAKEVRRFTEQHEKGFFSAEEVLEHIDDYVLDKFHEKHQKLMAEIKKELNGKEYMDIQNAIVEHFVIRNLREMKPTRKDCREVAEDTGCTPELIEKIITKVILIDVVDDKDNTK